MGTDLSRGKSRLIQPFWVWVSPARRECLSSSWVLRGRHPGWGCSGTSACSCQLRCTWTAVWVPCKAVFDLIGAVPDRADPIPLPLLSCGCLVIPWLQDELSGCWAWKCLSFSLFPLFKLVKWSHLPSDSMTSRSRLGHGDACLGVRRRRRLCWVSLCSLPMKHKWNHVWLFRAVPRTTGHCLSCLYKLCYRWRPLQTRAVGLFKEFNVNNPPCGCRSSPYSVLNTSHRTSVEA